MEVDSSKDVVPLILDEVEFDSYSDAELLSLYTLVKEKSSFLTNENKLFESYLLRVSPNAMKSNLSSSHEHQHNPVEELVEKNFNGRREERRKKKGEKSKDADKPILLTTEQKSEIATRELEELRDEIEKQKNEWGKLLDNYKAEMEEVDIRVAETKKASYEFKRDIVSQAVNPRTGKIVAERILRYFEDKTRAKDAIIEKLRLKNASLKVQKNKLYMQLKQKEEMGEVLHAIDFDQLQIENKQYLTKIEDRNAELLKLKMTAGNTVQILNFYKRKLQSLTKESEKLVFEIHQRQDLREKLTSETKLVKEEKEKSEKSHNQLRLQTEEYKVPHVMDYVQVKSQQHELQKRLKSWERKVEISEMQTNRVKRIWHAMNTHYQAQNGKSKHEKNVK